MEHFQSVQDFVFHYFSLYSNKENLWYDNYQATYRKIKEKPLSDEIVELLWYKRDNSVSSLKQGAPSKAEMERAKHPLRELTQQILESPNADMYQRAQAEMQRLKDAKLLDKNYGAMLNRVFAAIAPDKLTSTVREKPFLRAAKILNEQFNLGLPLSGNWFDNNVNLKQALRKLLPKEIDDFKVNVAFWNFSSTMDTSNYIKDAVDEDKASYEVVSPQSLNQIFYGPPGTGKTYKTIDTAVSIVEPAYKAETRAQLKRKYDELVRQKRIQFVTFHQSYGYEEFVEGLRAVTEDGQIKYEVKPGIFKRICTHATSNLNSASNESSIEFEVCWNAFLNAFDEDKGITIQTKRSWFRITGVSETTIYFEKAQGDSHHTLAISTLKEVFNETRLIKGGLNVYYQPLIEHLKSMPLPNEKAENFVLIIDEINRGNISKIFGELITLIEESKRTFSQNSEAIEVMLPYSGAPFSVPSNLYILGTMNTADRSLALMDTALRRRFEFIEMLPEPSVFEGVAVRGICLATVLSTLNERIDALYDREHALGHAFLIPVKAALEKDGEIEAFAALKQVFLTKFIPLLEEYFFDDWNKIRLVLGDNQKPKELQFIKVSTRSYGSLFGANNAIDSYQQQTQTFRVASYDDQVWDTPQAYSRIYLSSQAGEEV